MATLSAPTVSLPFPAGTQDVPFQFVVTGTLADGTPFSQTIVGPDVGTASAEFTLAPGTYTGYVSKLGVNSQTSAPLTITAPQVVLLVPDDTAAATLSA